MVYLYTILKDRVPSRRSRRTKKKTRSPDVLANVFLEYTHTMSIQYAYLAITAEVLSKLRPSSKASPS